MAETLSSFTAAEIRAELGRQGMSGVGLAQKLGSNQSWVARRLGEKTPITLADLERIADALGRPVSQFLLPGRRPDDTERATA